MKTSKEIRVINISYWANLLGRDGLAARLGKEDTNYINQLCKGHGSFGDAAARKIEAKLGIERGWFDHLHPDIYEAVQEEPAEYLTDRTTSPQVPVLDWDFVSTWCESATPPPGAQRFKQVHAPFAHGPKSFALIVHGLSMDPEYRDGDHILVDPDLSPAHNDDVVAMLPEGNYTFKRYQKTPEGNQFIALNGDFPDRILKIPEKTRILGVVIGSWTIKRQQKQ